MPCTLAFRFIFFVSFLLLFSGCVSLNGIYSQSTSSPPGSPYASAVLADQPILYFRLQESAGATALDQVSGSPLGVYGAQTVFGILGPFFDSEGADANSVAIGIANAGPALTAPVSLVAGFSIEAWVQIPSTLAANENPVLIQFGNLSQPPWAALTYNAQSAQLSFSHYDSNGAANSVSTDFSDYTDQWVAVIATSDSVTGGNLTLLLNGDPAAQQAISSSGAFSVINGLQALSGLAPGDSPVAISELAIYSSVLSPNQAARHFSASDM